MTKPSIPLTEPIGPAGAPVLMLGHSLGTGTLLGETAAPALREQFRVTLPTLPGHEGTAVPTAPYTIDELAAAVAEVGREVAGGRFLYAGVSIGGAIALQLGRRHPDAVAAVASIASGASLGGRAHWQSRATLVREQSPASLVGPSSKTWFEPESFTREPVLLGRLLRVLQETPTEAYALAALALAEYDIRAELGGIEVPVLAMYGATDTVAAEDRQDEIVADVRNGRKLRIDGASHQPPAEQPAATAQGLLEFFEEAR